MKARRVQNCRSVDGGTTPRTCTALWMSGPLLDFMRGNTTAPQPFSKYVAACAFHGCSADAGVLAKTACHCAADMRLSPIVKKASAYMKGRPVPFATNGTCRGGAWITMCLRVSRELFSASVNL